MMLAQVLETKSSVVHAVPVMSLASEMVDLVEKRNADIVCVSATPPGAMMHARYLGKQLRRRFPNVKLVVGLWDAQGDLNKAKDRIGCGATVVATLTDAQEQIRLMIEEGVPKKERPAPAEYGPIVRPKAHPSNYPSHIDVRSALQGARQTNSADSRNL